MNYVTLNRVLLCTVVVSIAVLAIKVFESREKSIEASSVVSQGVLHELPVDVESVREGFGYSETLNGTKIDISGMRIVRRGRKVLGLRSTLVKTNYLGDISGSVHFTRDQLKFTASKAEWEIAVTRPLILQKDIAISLNGKSMPDIKSAKIYFAQGLLEVTSDCRRMYKLK